MRQPPASLIATPRPPASFTAAPRPPALRITTPRPRLRWSPRLGARRRSSPDVGIRFGRGDEWDEPSDAGDCRHGGVPAGVVRRTVIEGRHACPPAHTHNEPTHNEDRSPRAPHPDPAVTHGRLRAGPTVNDGRPPRAVAYGRSEGQEPAVSDGSGSPSRRPRSLSSRRRTTTDGRAGRAVNHGRFRTPDEPQPTAEPAQPSTTAAPAPQTNHNRRPSRSSRRPQPPGRTATSRDRRLGVSQPSSTAGIRITGGPWATAGAAGIPPNPFQISATAPGRQRATQRRRRTKRDRRRRSAGVTAAAAKPMINLS